MDFADLVGSVKRREKVVTIITSGDLLAEHDAAADELAKAMQQTRTSLAAGGSTQELAQRVSDLEAQIAEATVSLRLRALGRNEFRRLIEAHPSEDGPFDVESFPPALIAACAVDPELSEAQAHALGDLLSDGQWEALFDAAWSVCREVPDGVPFNVLASSMIHA